MFRLFDGVLFAAAVLFVADRFPTFDVEEFCHDVATMAAPIADEDICLRKQRRAREALVRHWTQFPAADRSFCVEVATIGDHPATYTHLLTCLELERAVRRLREREREATGQR
jgi:hypothetical protein